MAKIDLTVEEVDDASNKILSALVSAELAHPDSPHLVILHTALAETLDALLEKFPDEEKPARRSGGGKPDGP